MDKIDLNEVSGGKTEGEGKIPRTHKWRCSHCDLTFKGPSWYSMKTLIHPVRCPRCKRYKSVKSKL